MLTLGEKTLVPARSLINGTSVPIHLSVREVIYIYLLLPHHQIL